MAHSVRPADESSYKLGRHPECIVHLERAIQDLLSDFGGEAWRLKAMSLARSMAAGCDSCGLKESSGILRSIESLLSLPQEETFGLKLSLAQRLLELIALLKEQASSSRN